MRWFRFLVIGNVSRKQIAYSAIQVVFSSEYLDLSRVSIRTQSLPLIASRNWIAESMLRPVEGRFCILRGGFRSRMSRLLFVRASLAIVTFIFIASLTACCRAARLSTVGFVRRAGTSSPLPIVLQPARTSAEVKETNANL